MTNALARTIVDNRIEIEATIAAVPDWTVAATHFDTLFNRMINPEDTLWPQAMIDELYTTYYRARDEDKACANITERTVKAMPASRANDTKIIMLQIASACRIFHAGHKVNFEPAEIPDDFPEIPMAPGKKKGFFSFANDMPTLYPKISLTFDYWVPKMLDWTQEIREKGFTAWKGETSFQHESCTDFMRIALNFLSDFRDNLPVCKQAVRQILIEKIFQDEFIWIKKSAKREDISANNIALTQKLNETAADTGITIPLESWSRILAMKPIKVILK